MQKKLLLILALLCAVAQGAWAQEPTWTEVGNETALNNAVTDGAYIKLTADIALSNYLGIGDGESFTPTVTLDLNGHTLSRSLSESSDYGMVVWVRQGGTLTVEDSSGDNSGQIKGGNSTNGGGIANNGTMTLAGGTISSCQASNCGGGIYNGPEYSGANAAKLTMTGGTITSNRADTAGGGVFSYSSISMSGSPNITGNENGNLYLNGSSTKINCGTFVKGDDGANIGVSLSDYNRNFTSGYSEHNSFNGNAEFSADVDGCELSTSGVEYYLGTPSGSVLYVERSWTGKNTSGHVVTTQKIATGVSNFSMPSDKTLGDGWYLLSGNHTGDKGKYKDRLTIDGDVKFILQDGCNIEFDKGIYIKKGKTLRIYGQTNGTGYLYTDGSDGENGSIGGNEDNCGGSLVIHGGKVYAKPGSNNSAGIGGGDGSSSGMQSITIYGGTVTAEGKSSGAGIGGGQENTTKPTIKIYGGTVTATGGDYAAGIGGGEETSNGEIYIYGGTVTAKSGKNAAGIGSGEDAKMEKEIYIYGGTVKATGGENGAGIGSGNNNTAAQIYIEGGDVTAQGGKNAAGIGAGGGENGSFGPQRSYNDDSLQKPLYIKGGTVRATGGENAPGIGAGKEGHDFSKYYIKGGTVYATGGKSAPGIGKGDFLRLYVQDGYVEATSRGADAACIGGRQGCPGGTVEITGGTVKCIFTNEYSHGDGSDNVMYIGRGGCTSSGGDGSVSLPNTYSVTKDGTTVSSANRVSTCKSHPTGYSTITIQSCSHSDISYTYKNSSYHQLKCSNCEGYEEFHTGIETCTKCGYGTTTNTLTFYEANSEGTGYSSTPDTRTGYYQKSFSLPQCSSVPDKMAFVGWEKTNSAPASIEAEDSELSSLKGAGSSVTVTEDVTYYARYQTVWTGSGDGTSDDPYQISTAEQWDYIAGKVNNGITTYSGKYFKMTGNIGTSENPVTTMIGEYNSDSKYFEGNFNGDGKTLNVSLTGSSQGVAPFGCVKDATISSLHVSGTIEASDKFAAGLIGSAYKGTTNIVNCRVSVTINSEVSGDGTHGGFVAHIQHGTTNITRCVFDGSMLGSSTTGWGGFAGWIEAYSSNKLYIKNCLFKPATLEASDGATFARGDNNNKTNINVSSSYYTQSFGTVQGTQGYTIESDPDNDKLYLYYGNESETIAELQQYENEVRTYDSGLLYQKKFYTGGSSKVTFTPLTTEYGQEATDVTASAGTLTNNGNGTYTLAMNNGNSSVTASIETYGSLTLNDASANTETLESNAGQTKNVTLSGRKLWKDGDWNTLCLPFDVSEDYMKNSDHPLYGATIMELNVDDKWKMDNGQWIIDNENGEYQTGFDSATGTLYLYFLATTSIDAGVPCLVKWTTTGDPITSPTFYSSYIESSIPKTVRSEDGKVSFIGNFDPVTLTGGDKSVLYLGADNQLYYPAEDHDRTINAFRAYFQLNGITAGDITNGARLFFGDSDETTGVGDATRLIDNGKLIMDNGAEANSSLFTLHSSLSGWYDLQGRRVECSMFNVQRSMLKKGVYIVNGKKVVIK